MVKANELRIDNLFLLEKKVVSILEISQDEIWSKEIIRNTRLGLCLCHLEELEPIPLTEEWILKAGFKKRKLEGYEVHFMYEHPKLHSCITAIYNADFSMSLDNVARGIKYIHNLQNLFFAITGEELSFYNSH